MRQQRSKEWFLEHVVVCVLQNPWHHTNTLERQAITSHRRGSIGPAGRVFTDWLHKLLLKMLKSVRNQGSAEPQTGAAAGVMQKKVESRMATFLMRPHPVTLRVWCFRGGEEASRKIGAGGGRRWGEGVGGVLHRQKLICKYCEFVSQQKGQPFLYLIRSLFIFSKWKPCSKRSVNTRTPMYSQCCRLIFFFWRQPLSFPKCKVFLFHSHVSHFFPCFLQPAKVRSVPSSRSLMLPGMQRLWMEAQSRASKSLLRDQLGSLGLENIQRPLKMGCLRLEKFSSSFSELISLTWSQRSEWTFQYQAKLLA